jgi:hypothetical protein
VAVKHICLIQVQLDVKYILYFFLDNVSSTCFGCYSHPSSGAQLQRTAIGFVWFCVLFHWKKYWFGTTLHFSKVSYRIINLMFVVPYILVTYMFNSSPTKCTLCSLFLSFLAGTHI